MAPGKRPKLLAIVGPTASGKSDLAMKVAEAYEGEIICADSRTVYKGMDIGTAKPTPKDQKKLPHWGLDLVEPGQAFSAYQFKNYAQDKIKEIQSRDKLPILVGGTGLYIDGLLFDFGFLPAASPQKHAKLAALNVEQLQAIIDKEGYKMPVNSQNRRHLIRTIETKGQKGAKKPHLDAGVALVGLMPEDNTLKARITKRAASKLGRRFIEEAGGLLKKYGEKALRQSGGIAYLACLDYLNGKVSQQEMRTRVTHSEWQYARRQRTWFRRNPYVKWFSEPDAAFEAISRLLNT